MNMPHQLIQRLDYTPSSFLIDRTDLTFELHETETRVQSRLVLHRNPQATLDNCELTLLGEDLILESIKLDGHLLELTDIKLTPTSLTLPKIEGDAILEIVTRINPAENTTLMGLYQSNGNLFTQCEAEGFRRITYYLDRPDVMSRFTVTLIADKRKYPILLSNGNRIGEGTLDHGRQWVKWVDPFPKPPHLFALVAGKLVSRSVQHTTPSGRLIRIEIYVEPGHLNQSEHALSAAKKAMRWDESRFGLEYDLDTYMMVAVSDFNMGAMENKGLNIFNTKCILAKPDSATDADFEYIDAVVAHEYCHNWTGNRVGCRDWFQLSLKEGLTVYRDQEFSSDLMSRAVQRIQDVRFLRENQFAEDAGPQAHPVRPDAYIEIDNFYTCTVYEKGAEVVRMIATLVGQEGFRKGIDLYFQCHDGQAVTCDDFVAAMADANQIDLSQFKYWYSQAGTPILDIEGIYDEQAQTYTLTVHQSCPPTPGQAEKQPFHIPLAIGLLGPDGQDLPLVLSSETKPVLPLTTRVLELRQPVEVFTFVDLSAPTPSFLRDFSAPVRLHFPYSDEALIFLMAHDNNAFARWEATQTFAVRLLKQAYLCGKGDAVSSLFINALKQLLKDEHLDPALIALMLELPHEKGLLEEFDEVDPGKVHAVLLTLKQQIAHELKQVLLNTYLRLHNHEPYSYDTNSVARRSLKNVCLNYLSEVNETRIDDLLTQQYQHSDNMTDRLAALRALVNRGLADKALFDFEKCWYNEALVMDKWFALQAVCRRPGTLSRVQALMEHPTFSIRNPNKVRALISAFCLQNLNQFHAPDGQGYTFAADRIIELDRLNPHMAARLATCFNLWGSLEPHRKALMKVELDRVSKVEGLSSGTFEIISKIRNHVQVEKQLNTA